MKAISTTKITKIKNYEKNIVDDRLVKEVALGINLNNTRVATMMVTLFL